jgi:hypothetical protein
VLSSVFKLNGMEQLTDNSGLNQVFENNTVIRNNNHLLKIVAILLIIAISIAPISKILHLETTYGEMCCVCNLPGDAIADF